MFYLLPVRENVEQTIDLPDSAAKCLPYGIRNTIFHISPYVTSIPSRIFRNIRKINGMYFIILQKQIPDKLIFGVRYTENQICCI